MMNPWIKGPIKATCSALPFLPILTPFTISSLTFLCFLESSHHTFHQPLILASSPPCLLIPLFLLTLSIYQFICPPMHLYILSKTGWQCHWVLHSLWIKTSQLFMWDPEQVKCFNSRTWWTVEHVESNGEAKGNLLNELLAIGYWKWAATFTQCLPVNIQSKVESHRNNIKKRFVVGTISPASFLQQVVF